MVRQMSDLNLLQPIVTQDAVIDLLKQEIALWEKLVDSYKRSEKAYEDVIAAQDKTIAHLKAMDDTKNDALSKLGYVLNNAASAFPGPRLF
jgi:hypothetical protein